MARGAGQALSKPQQPAQIDAQSVRARLSQRAGPIRMVDALYLTGSKRGSETCALWGRERAIISLLPNLPQPIWKKAHC